MNAKIYEYDTKVYRTKTVSYTHLDVYKRQVLSRKLLSQIEEVPVMEEIEQ